VMPVTTRQIISLLIISFSRVRFQQQHDDVPSTNSTQKETRQKFGSGHPTMNPQLVHSRAQALQRELPDFVLS